MRLILPHRCGHMSATRVYKARLIPKAEREAKERDCPRCRRRAAKTAANPVDAAAPPR